MAKLFNLARMTTATTGTGAIALGAAVAGFLSFAQAGVADGDVVTYGIKDGSSSEIGEGTYSAATGTLTRSVLKSTNGNAAINLSGAAEVYITPSHKHFFDQGTACLFVQTAAPTGWTKQTTHNDKALRIVSGTASSGGTNAFSTVMGQTSVGSYTLGIADIPSHQHQMSVNSAGGSGSNAAPGYNSSYPTGFGSLVSATGGGGSHAHSITMAIQYVDAIIATKD